MLKVTADIFSGRPNPHWMLADDEARHILAMINKKTEVIDFTEPNALGLGYRGLILDMVKGDAQNALRLPTSFRITNSTPAGAELSERLISQMTAKVPHSDFGGFDAADIQKILKQGNASPFVKPPAQIVVTKEMLERLIKALKAWIEFLQTGGCTHEEIPFDPNFWNDAAHVHQNNCYNFATNRRTDTFAQPGRATGHMYTSIDCAAVKAAAISDGAVVPPPCPPDAESPRYWIALVIAPGWPDFHWYRRCSEGFWAHKPGGTPARNTDNSGQLILDPEHCDRGPYTNFCGYMYTRKDMVVN